MVNFSSHFRLNYISAYGNNIGVQSLINRALFEHYPVTLRLEVKGLSSNRVTRSNREE